MVDDWAAKEELGAGTVAGIGDLQKGLVGPAVDQWGLQRVAEPRFPTEATVRQARMIRALAGSRRPRMGPVCHRRGERIAK